METNINPLIGANTRETVENAAEALSAVIELMPEGSPIKITPAMEAKGTFIYTAANIAHSIKCVRDILEDEVVNNLDLETIRDATLQIAEGRLAADKLAKMAKKVAGLGLEESITDGIEHAAAHLSQLIVNIADEHSGLCRLLSPVLHALECVGEAPAPARGFSRAECAA